MPASAATLPVPISVGTERSRFFRSVLVPGLEAPRQQASPSSRSSSSQSRTANLAVAGQVAQLMIVNLNECRFRGSQAGRRLGNRPST